MTSAAKIAADTLLGLTPVINAAGFQTRYGAASVPPEIIAAAASVMSRSVVIDELQDIASAAIVDATGAEAGCITACAAAGITVSVAAAMTGPDVDKVARLPDVTGMKNEVIIAAGHDCDFGARVSQMIRLAGARVISAGIPRQCGLLHLRECLSERTAAAVFVTSDHVDAGSAPPLKAFCDLMHNAGVPVIADCAAEDDLYGFLAQGADIAIYSAHKVRRGLTAGILAGRSGLIAACRLQSQGIGRPMKVGKEGIAGAITALRRWPELNHNAIRAIWRARIDVVIGELAGIDGLRAEVELDANGNPVPRCKVKLAGEGGEIAVAELIQRLAGESPAILLRETENEPSAFLIDPRSLTNSEARFVATRIAETVGQGRAG